jgi:hypothetical protein
MPCADPHDVTHRMWHESVGMGPGMDEKKDGQTSNPLKLKRLKASAISSSEGVAKQDNTDGSALELETRLPFIIVRGSRFDMNVEV